MATTFKGFASDWSVPTGAKAKLDELYPPKGDVVRKGELRLNVRDYGVKGDGTTDDTPAIQALINAQPTTGAALFFPAGTYRISNLTLPAYIQLVGAGEMYGYGPQGKGVTRFQAVTGSTGWMVDSTGSGTAVVGIDFRGLSDGVTGSTGGIRSNGAWCRFSEIHFEGFKESALKIETGNACVVDNILAFNCVMNRGVTAPTGVMDIAGNDHWVTRVEANTSQSGGASSANLYVNSWVIRSTNAFIANCVGEFGDRGYYITGSKNRFTGCRADRNMGIGYEVVGSNNTFAACMGVDNSSGVNDTYPGFKTSGMNNSFAGCLVTSLSTARPTYAFEDTVSNSDPRNRNNYVGCSGIGVRGTFKGDGYLGSSFALPDHVVRVSGNPTVIPVGASTFHNLHSYNAATTVTDFSGGHSGQTIRLLGSPQVTIAHGATIKTKSQVNMVLDGTTIYTFTHYNGVWYEG